MDQNISALLKAIKDKTGWSETRLAERIRVSQPTVNRILQGQPDCKGSTLTRIKELYQDVFSSRSRRRSNERPPPS